ncbi:DUF1622 domain-containing protein [Massilia sp. CCM 9210]|uniref:DUF1622 domain-containing protein n=1 Tax=Massilia scottii TaxID=3057166 RepID=UPI0027967413|nr:DUF1622 domain-containing protein [Massilia sp. CCM 9210]MDQ1812040.1 DUF1622 domain-containing protein [Massilia sp. CCM 9210]
MFADAENLTRSAVAWLRLGVETLGALVIAVGILVALTGFARHLIASRAGGFNPVRLQLARYLGLALELQLAADILSTAIAPSWEQIGKLAAVAIIRTGLNYFLMIETRQEEGRSEQARPAPVAKESQT